MTQILEAATRNTIDSVTLIDEKIHNLFFNNPDYGILEADLT